MRRIVVIALAVTAAAIAACGGNDKADQAKTQVCDAKADISKQVDTLKNLTVSTATTSQIKSSLTAIGDDLKSIANAQGNLDDQRKSQVQQATATFSSQVADIASSLGSTTSLATAKTQLSSSLDQLASSYQQAFAKVDCS